MVGIAPERVDHLLGERPLWELPVSLLAGGLITVIALLVFVASASHSRVRADQSRLSRT